MPRPFAEPAEVEAGELPHAVKAEAAGHDRVALEVTREEPEIGGDVEFGAQITLVECTAGFRDVGDPVHHQHRRQRQLGVAGSEELAFRTFQDLVISVARLPVDHEKSVSSFAVFPRGFNWWCAN
jgi:hypothetical protein